MMDSTSEGGLAKVDAVVSQRTGATGPDDELLRAVEAGMGILADVNRADVLLYSAFTAAGAVAVAHSRPHSVAPVYAQLQSGTLATPEAQPLIFRAAHSRLAGSLSRSAIANGAPIIQSVTAVRNAQGRVIAVLCVEKNLIEHERHRRRSPVFQWAASCMQGMAARGELAGAHVLTPFGEHDGILVVDTWNCIRYASSIATNLYRRMGLVEGLVGKRVDEIGASDAEMVAPVFAGAGCVEHETHEGGRDWIKRGVPIRSLTRGWAPLADLERFIGLRLERNVRAALILIRDTTESRLKEQELKVKTAMIREVHHRVKNNLQTIAALLRMQARRSPSEEVQQALHEGINRILSVAVVHEFLAHQEEGMISLREVANKIVRQTRQGMLDPEKRIRIDLVGPDVMLSAQQATSCALIMNELLLNSIEHGFEGTAGGAVTVELCDSEMQVTILVKDDGASLPADFNIERVGSLGLQIVRTLVQNDLKGVFQLENQERGVVAVVTFPKHLSGGE